MVSLAFWAWVLAPDSAGPLVVACSLLGQLLNGRTTWQGFRLRAAWPFIAGGLLGVPVGAWLLPLIDAGRFRLGFGIFLVCWCSAMLLSRRLPRVARGGVAGDAAAGWLGGVLGGIGGLSGPIPTLWVTLRGWDKASQRAMFQAFNTSMHVLALSAFAAKGLVGAEELRLFALAVPCMLLPLWAGTRVYARLGEHDYRRVVMLLLLAAGVALIANGIPKPG
jgi:hypothetical protein